LMLLTRKRAFQVAIVVVFFQATRPRGARVLPGSVHLEELHPIHRTNNVTLTLRSRSQVVQTDRLTETRKALRKGNHQSRESRVRM